MRETRWSSYYDDKMSKSDYSSDLTLYEALCDAVKRYPGEIALRYASRKYTYEQLKESVDRTASYFHSVGIEAGDKILICSGGLPSVFLSIYAANKLGAIPVVIYGELLPFMFRRVATEQTYKLAIISNKQIDSYATILGDINISRIIITSPTDFLGVFGLLEGRIRKYLGRYNYRINKSFLSKEVSVSFWKEVENHTITYEEQANVQATDVAILFRDSNKTCWGQYSEFDSKSLNEQAKQLSIFLPRDVDASSKQIICFLDPAFVSGFILGYHSVFLNGYTILLKSFSYGIKAIDQLLYYRSPIITGLPSTLAMLSGNRKLRLQELDFIRKVVSYGEPMIGSEYNEFYDFIKRYAPNAKIDKFFGSAETCSAFAFNPPELDNSSTVGIPLPGVMVKVFDENENELPEGVTGDIFVSCSSTFLGYYKDPEMTDHIIRKYRDGRVWIMTGERGYIDANGYIYSDDNNYNRIESNGVVFYPGMLEKEILSLDGVVDCLVCNVQDSKVVAAIVPDEEYLFDNNMMDKLRERIIIIAELYFPSEFYPENILFKTVLPKTKKGDNNYHKFIEDYVQNNDDMFDIDVFGTDIFTNS